MRQTFPLLTLLLCASAARAAENNLDLRVGLGGTTGVDRVHDRDADTTDRVGDDGGGNFEVNLIYLRAAPHDIGFAVGGGVFGRTHESADSSADHPVVNAGGVQAQGALVFRPTRNWHFEIPALTLSAGSAQVSHDHRHDSDSGDYSAVSLHLGAFYTFRFNLQLGAELGIQSWAASVRDDDGTGDRHRFRYSGSGGYGNFVVGVRF